MKPVSIWVFLGMSLLFVTGATAQSLMGFFNAIAAINKNAPTSTTGVPITDKTATLQGTVINGNSELVQMNFLIENRMRSIKVQAETPDTSNLNDLLPPAKDQGNVTNRLELTNDNDLIF